MHQLVIRDVGGLQAGETALQRLAKKFTEGDESQLTEALQKAQLIVGVRMGDLAEMRHLIECEGIDVSTRDNVSCGFIGDS